VNKFKMNRKLSTEERVFVLQKWWQHDHSYRDVVDLFVERFPNSVPPSRQAIYNLNKRFEQTGSVADFPRSGTPKAATTEENLNIVAHCEPLV
jgi:transposase